MGVKKGLQKPIFPSSTGEEIRFEVLQGQLLREVFVMTPFEIAITVFMGVIAVGFIAIVYRLWTMTEEIEKFFFTLTERSSPLLQELESVARNLENISTILEERATETDAQLQNISNTIADLQAQTKASINEWKNKLSPQNISGAGIVSFVFKGIKAVRNLRKKSKTSNQEDIPNE